MKQIEILLNGKKHSANEGEILENFVKSLGLNPKRCVVEINGKAYSFKNFQSKILKDGDSLEIMKIVAGG